MCVCVCVCMCVCSSLNVFVQDGIIGSMYISDQNLT